MINEWLVNKAITAKFIIPQKPSTHEDKFIHFRSDNKVIGKYPKGIFCCYIKSHYNNTIMYYYK